jgi:signal transduction histidine kinase
VETARHKIGRREWELSILNEVGLAATQLLDVQDILELAQDTMVTKLGMDVSMIYLLDETSGRYTLRISHGLTKKQKAEISHRRKSGHDITQDVVDTGKEVFIPNMAEDKRLFGVWDNLDQRSYIKLPLLSRGTVVGVLGLVTQVGNLLDQHSADFLKAVGREIGIAIDNALLLEETRLRESQAITLNQLGTKISSSLSLGEVLFAVADAARHLVRADIGLVGLIDEEFYEVVIKAVSGNKTDMLIGLNMPIGEGAPWKLLLDGKPIMSSGAHPDQPCLHDRKLIESENIKALMAAPLQRSGKFLGLIEVMTRDQRHFRERDANLLLRLANQVIVAIENAQLVRQLRNLAALEERDRLAREMHDHLAQGLGYLKVKASITEDILTSGDRAKALESLQELKKVSQILYTDVREQIFNLRTAVTEQVGFLSTLQEYLSDYRNHYGLNVHLVVENECLSDFSPEVGSQLLRIVQEALTNVRKHSNAGKVMIHCSQGGDQVVVSIEDDGKGFLPSESVKEDEQRYGLQIMRERAETVGGSLVLDSQPGQGTRVLVRVPATLE